MTSSATATPGPEPLAGVARYQPVPEASPRSVTCSPVRQKVSQSWGRNTRSVPASTVGSFSANHASFVIVNAATGTEPHSLAQRCAPISATIRSAWGADSVSFQSFAGRSGTPVASVTTRPCC